MGKFVKDKREASCPRAGFDARIAGVLALVLVVAVSPVVSRVSQARAASASSRIEYQVKAAFLFNFIKFVDWPKEKAADNNDVITIGIIGKDPFGKTFDPIEGRKVKNCKVAVKRFKGFKELTRSAGKDTGRLEREIKALRKCHVLFVCPSEKKQRKQILELVEGGSVLTVGDVESFLKAGGVINFFISEGKVRFEINVTVARQAKLKIRSQLLRLAKRATAEVHERNSQSISWEFEFCRAQDSRLTLHRKHHRRGNQQYCLRRTS